MEILEVSSKDDIFSGFCKKLQNYQYNLLPGIEEKGYCLTDDLDEIIVAFVLYVDAMPAGSIGLKKVTDDTCEIVRVFVSEDYRGKGYSRILLQAVEQKAKLMGFSRAEIIAWQKAEVAVSLYKKSGYEVFNEGVSQLFGGYGYVELAKNL